LEVKVGVVWKDVGRRGYIDHSVTKSARKELSAQREERERGWRTSWEEPKDGAGEARNR
jgi:hypothetical protein